MSTSDYNDGYAGRKKARDPFGPASTSGAYEAGVRAREKARQNFIASFPTLPDRKVTPNYAVRGVSRPRRYREPATFESVAANLLALVVGGLIFYVGIWVLNIFPAWPLLGGIAAGWITEKLFKGPLRFLLVFLKYAIKTVLFLAAGALVLYLILTNAHK